MMSAAVVLRRRCCGCSLKTGTILIAFWYLATSMVHVAMMVFCLQQGGYEGGPHDRTFMKVPSTQPQQLESLRGLYTLELLIIFLVMAVCELISCAVLLYGADKERYGLILQWIIIETLVIASISAVTLKVSLALLPEEELHATGVAALVSCSIYVVVNAYLILVVCSFCRRLRGRLSSKQLLVNG